MKIIVTLDVEARDKEGGWRFFVGTLKEILIKVFAARFAQDWDYRFKVISVYRIDEEA